MEQTNVPTANAETSALPMGGQQAPQTGCTGNCMNCHPLQRNYCAAKISYNIQDILCELLARIERLQASVDAMQEQVRMCAENAEQETPELCEAPAPTAKKKKGKQ